MNDLLGIPMGTMLNALLVFLSLCLLSVAWVAWRRPVVFKLGVRNIPRRHAQTTFPTMAYHNININEDQQAAYEESKRFLDAYYGPVFSESMVRAWTALGSPEECIEQIRRLRDAGAQAMTLRLTSWDQQRQYQRLVEEVLPNV